MRDLRLKNNDAFVSLIETASPEEALLLSYDWEVWARAKQLLPPGDWDNWLIKAGRGFGKTRAGAETVRIWARDFPIIHLVAATASDARDIMVEGESGVLAISPAYERPIYSSSNRRLTWPNGSKAILFSADEPDRLRGPQCYKAWADELATWRYPDAWDQLLFGLRLGSHPQCVITTTPRPTDIIRQLATDEKTIVTSGTTYENRDNLAPSFIHTMERKYKGTRLGRQELDAEILETVEGALWNLSMIDKTRETKLPESIVRSGVGVDPAGSRELLAAETGLICGCKSAEGHYYIFNDSTGKYSPNGWAMRVAALYHGHKMDAIVAENNYGGEMVASNIKTVDHEMKVVMANATRGKILRAEPISALYEQGLVHHVGFFPELEDEMTHYTGESKQKSPNRLDALVWILTWLKESESKQFWVSGI